MIVLAPMLSFSWLSAGYSLADHIWQSTLFAGVAAALTLVLRRNHAQTRYWLWFIASLKFLIPFSLLIGLGTNLPGAQRSGGSASPISFVVEEISRPFAATTPAQAAMSPVHASGAVASYLVPVGLLAVWLCGCVVTLFFWWRRWRRIKAALRRAPLVKSGREFETLYRLGRSAQLVRMPALAISESSFEPGIVGVFRPVMVLPAGIADRLTDSQLEAIVTHELCHVRRRDNLAAALHMLAEALFWFHPLVWWIGARLVDERERACDEEVLALGSKPQTYAESILKVCEFYLETPLVCAAGVTGSNLKKRIEAIMVHRIARKLEVGKKLLLAVLAAAVVVAPVALGILHPASSQAQSHAQSSATGAIQIDSASIQPSDTEAAKPGPTKEGKPVVSSRMIFAPDRFKAANVTLAELIRAAFGVQKSQISGGPDWINTNLYDEEVRFTAAPGTDHIQGVTQLRLELRKLLADRFKLRTHSELKQLTVFELAVGPGGSKLAEAKTSSGAAKPVPSLMQKPAGHFTGKAIDMATLVPVLEWQLGTPVIDKTGLKGAYDFSFVVEGWPPQQLPSDPAPLLKAVSEQLGLELKPATDLVEVLVIDHAEPVINEKKDLAQAQ